METFVRSVVKENGHLFARDQPLHTSFLEEKEGGGPRRAYSESLMMGLEVR